CAAPAAVPVTGRPPPPPGKGAIDGLLIDDRYRPIPAAFLLLEPLGLTATTDGEGQFRFVDLDPGSYTPVAQADGHEAAPPIVAGMKASPPDGYAVATRCHEGNATSWTETSADYLKITLVRTDTPHAGNYTQPHPDDTTNDWPTACPDLSARLYYLGSDIASL